MIRRFNDRMGMNSDATTTPQQGERGHDLWLDLEQEESM